MVTTIILLGIAFQAGDEASNNSLGGVMQSEHVQKASSGHLVLQSSVGTKRPTETPDYLKLEPPWTKGPDCGPNCLYILAKLCGHDVSIEEVHRLAKVDADQGCSLADLERAANTLGFKVAVRFVTPEALKSAPCPFIVHCAQSENIGGTGHFLVIVAHRQNGEICAAVDPTSREPTLLPVASLRPMFTGYVLAPLEPPSTLLLKTLRYSFYGVAVLVFGLACYAYRLQRSVRSTR